MDNKNWLTRTSNPTLNDKTFAGLPQAGVAGEAKTLQGTINKSFLLLVVLLAAALWPWSQYLSGGGLAAIAPTIWIGALGGFALALVISFKATLAPYLSIPYAVCEGLAIGGFSAVLEKRYPGIAVQAVGLTFGVMAALLLAYTLGLIHVTQRFRAIVVDMGDIEPEQARRVPLASWYRFRLQAEKSQTILLLVAQTACAHSCASVVLHCMEAEERWQYAAHDKDGAPAGLPLLTGFRYKISADRKRGSAQESFHSGKKKSASVTSWNGTTQWAR